MSVLDEKERRAEKDMQRMDITLHTVRRSEILLRLYSEENTRRHEEEDGEVIER